MNKTEQNRHFDGNSLKFLIIAAHPDDELLGCGAYAFQLVSTGWKGKSLILGEGMRSRGENSNKALDQLKEDGIRANQCIGITDISFHDLPDNQFDSIPLLKIVHIIEKTIIDFKPDIIFTHYGHDLNVDHRLTFQAVMTVCRPQPNMNIPDIYSFYIPSSTDWVDGNVLAPFCPNVYVDIATVIEKKIEALAHYTSEMREYPHSRSLESIANIAKYWGNRVGLEFAEPLILVRKVIK